MNTEILHFIDNNFTSDIREEVINQLLSIELKHVMAESTDNLYNTRMAILHLADGNINEVIELTERAKIDFRDVILWATKKDE
ncbi:hypothetical protein [Tenacibaculum sp. M341]|uniref:hypothetical protein n=1 Tax=Tenacibaculum sp. M341 TaxID=2530339 RepID=UPI0010496D18|nr:hypothetical protein [Tenacibaculum sp. M341]TCI92181.1 hypothetical protein EYW44_08350 [Tenacibaculum sp. M341]